MRVSFRAESGVRLHVTECSRSQPWYVVRGTHNAGPSLTLRLLAATARTMAACLRFTRRVSMPGRRR